MRHLKTILKLYLFDFANWLGCDRYYDGVIDGYKIRKTEENEFKNPYK